MQTAMMAPITMPFVVSKGATRQTEEIPPKVTMARVAGRTFGKEAGAAGLEPATPGFGGLGCLSSHAGLRLLRTTLRTTRQLNDLPGDGAAEVLV